MSPEIVLPDGGVQMASVTRQAIRNLTLLDTDHFGASFQQFDAVEVWAQSRVKNPNLVAGSVEQTQVLREQIVMRPERPSSVDSSL
jgi:hypothetical protein